MGNETQDKERINTSITSSCNLLAHYQTIGHELLKYERILKLRAVTKTQALNEFRIGVSFINVEVLESYLDDLLDSSSSDESLFIERSKIWKIITINALGVLLASLIYFSLHPELLRIELVNIKRFTLPVSIIISFFFAWNLSPYSNTTRRLQLARILSGEINRRRGGGEIETGIGRLALTSIFSRDTERERERIRKGAPSTARVGYEEIL